MTQVAHQVQIREHANYNAPNVNLGCREFSRTRFCIEGVAALSESDKAGTLGIGVAIPRRRFFFSPHEPKEITAKKQKNPLRERAFL